MTREDILLNKAVDYSEVDENFLEFDDCGDTVNDKEFIIKAYLAGAKCADENPNKDLVYTKQELRDMGFGFDLNGNISTPQEIEEKTKKYIEYRKNKWAEEVVKWMVEQEYQEYPGGPFVKMIPEFVVEWFKKNWYKN